MKDLKECMYLTLTGNLIPSCRVPGVEDAFAEGSFCMGLYGEAMNAYESLCKRLGVEDEDEDVETIINNFMDIQWHIGLRMYTYGTIFGNKTKEEVYKHNSQMLFL